MGQVRRKRLHAILNFPASLPVAAESLGRTFDVKIGRIGTRITFPHSDEDPTWARLRVDMSKSDPLHPLVTHDDEFDWGSGENDSWHVHKALVSFLVSAGRHPNESEELGEFTEAFPRWFDTARRWVLAKLDRPAAGLSQSSPTVINGVHERRPWGLGGSDSMSLIVGRCASEQELKAAFRNASCGESLPLEHDLLLEARTALQLNDLRRAVVDSATASEVVLVQWLRRYLQQRGLTTDEAQAVTKGANGIVELYVLAVTLGLNLTVSKGRVINKIANPRNLAECGHLTWPHFGRCSSRILAPSGW